MRISDNEIISIAPLGALSIIYWLRDKYMFNRQTGRWYRSSRTQLYILVFAYPVWVFLSWTLGLQTSRGQVAASLITTTGKYTVGHYTIISLLNDSFVHSHQQFVSFFLGLVIAYIWTIFWLLTTADSE